MNFSKTCTQLILLSFLRSASSTCYYPDGSVERSLEFKPCSLVKNAVSMCCATNRTDVQDECLSNGLCFNPCGVDGLCGGTDKGQFWRESCTDQSWNSLLCLKGVCTNSTVSRNQSTDSDRDWKTDENRMEGTHTGPSPCRNARPMAPGVAAQTLPPMIVVDD